MDGIPIVSAAANATLVPMRCLRKVMIIPFCRLVGGCAGGQRLSRRELAEPSHSVASRGTSYLLTAEETALRQLMSFGPSVGPAGLDPATSCRRSVAAFHENLRVAARLRF